MPLTPSPKLLREEGLREILQTIYDLAVNGNVAAAKLYLDYHLKLQTPSGDKYEADDALKLFADRL